MVVLQVYSAGFSGAGDESDESLGCDVFVAGSGGVEDLSSPVILSGTDVSVVAGVCDASLSGSGAGIDGPVSYVEKGLSEEMGS